MLVSVEPAERTVIADPADRRGRPALPARARRARRLDDRRDRRASGGSTVLIALDAARARAPVLVRSARGGRDRRPRARTSTTSCRKVLARYDARVPRRSGRRQLAHGRAANADARAALRRRRSQLRRASAPTGCTGGDHVAPGGHLLFHDAVETGGYSTCSEGVVRLIAEIERDASVQFERRPGAGSVAHFVRSAPSGRCARARSRSASTIISISSSNVDLAASSRARARALPASPTQQVDLGRAQEARVDRRRSCSPVEADVAERDLARVADRVRLAGRDHVVVGLVLLQHQPHRADVVAGEAPVALRVEVAEAQLASPGRA